MLAENIWVRPLCTSVEAGGAEGTGFYIYVARLGDRKVGLLCGPAFPAVLSQKVGSSSPVGQSDLGETSGKTCI